MTTASSHPGPRDPLLETAARPPASADVGATIVRAPGSAPADLGETMARPPGSADPDALDVPRLLHETLAERFADGDARDGDPIRIGRFTVLTMLGEGGMGVVYAAYDLELDRKVAIKLVREDAHEGTHGHTSMLREAQAMAKLSHPNVVQIYEVGEHAGQIYVAMEFVKGRTLTAWLREPARTWTQIRDMFVQAGHGLADAHAGGLVHRDFKPDNVLVGIDERARVADFGLAGVETRRQALGESGRVSLSRLRELDASLSFAGAIQGTPAYMSPEQHLGRETDARSDIFSFCVALWEALYGERPFPGDTLDALREAVTAGELRAPPVGTLVPAWVHAALLPGLATAPERRPAAIDGLLLDLTRDLREPPRPRSRALPLAFGAFGLVTAAVVFIATRERDPTSEELAQIEALSGEARAAGERRHWVYPTAQAPADTAILRVVALEALDGPPARPADMAAAELRLELAAQLASLGDTYWDREGGRPFARDYYAQTLMFQPDHATARERGGLSPGELAELREKAVTSGFTAADVIAAEPLAILAESDGELRRSRLAAFQARVDRGTAVQKRLLLPLIERRGAAVDVIEAPTPEPAATGGAWPHGRGGVASDTAAALVEPTPEVIEPGLVASAPEVIEPGLVAPEPGEPPGPVAPGLVGPAAEVVGPVAPELVGPAPPPVLEPPPRRKPPPPPRPVRPEPEKAVGDPELASGLAERGEASRQLGELDAAEQLFNQALAASSVSTTALIGLSDVCFDRGQFEQAATYAERAVRLAPESADLRIRLGDAHYKALRFRDAQQQYERARELGSPDADVRLQKVKARIGG